MQAVEGLETKGDKKAAAQQIKALYETFVKSDCTMVEVFPVPFQQSPTLAQPFAARYNSSACRQQDSCSSRLGLPVCLVFKHLGKIACSLAHYAVQGVALGG